MADNFDFSSIDAASNSLSNSDTGAGMEDYASPPSPGQAASSEAAEPVAEAPASAEPVAPPAPTPEAGEMVDLGDGLKVPLASLLKWAGAAPPAEPTEAAAPPPAATVDPVLQRLEALEKLLTAQARNATEPAQPAAVQPQPIDPRTHPRDWLAARNNVYRTHAGRDATREELKFDLLQASSHLDRQELGQLKQNLTQTAQKAQVQQETQKVQTQIQGLIKTRFQNLDNEPGEQILNWALAHAAATGEKDMEKVVREASELLPKFIVAAYAKRKQSNIRSLSGTMPRSGGVKAPSKPSYGKDIDALDRVTADLIKSGRV